MKFAACLVSLASLASAAPALLSAVPPVLAAVPFPPKSKQPHVLSLSDAIQLMKPPTTPAAPPTDVSTISNTGNSGPEGSMGVMAGCRNDIRRRWGTTSPEERTNFVNAIQCLTRRPPRGIWNGARSIYDELVWVHVQMQPRVHEVDLFLPWHRYYLHIFKTLLREECGFNGPIPWWKETNNAGNLPASDIFSSQWFGAWPQAVNGNQGTCISNGAFAGLINRISGQCVARGEIKAETNEITVAWEEVCNGQQGSSFPQHRACVEFSNHARLHRGFGPTMADGAQSPADPIFFIHHQYIDWQWKRWQNQASWRWTSISGCADRANPCAPLTVNTRLTSMGLFREMTVAEVLDSENETMCYTYDLLV